MKNIILLFTISLILFSCGTLSDAGKVLRNEKKNTTDEFLVKKKRPLVLPPDYKELPKPGEIKDKADNNEEKIKKILKAPTKENKSNKPTSVEQSILKKIRKW